jgi:hypothetical protein
MSLLSCNLLMSLCLFTYMGHLTYGFDARFLSVVDHATTGPCFRLTSRNRNWFKKKKKKPPPESLFATYSWNSGALTLVTQGPLKLRRSGELLVPVLVYSLQGENECHTYRMRGRWCRTGHFLGGSCSPLGRRRHRRSRRGC